MELKEFIKKTLLDIVEAVNEVNEDSPYDVKLFGLDDKRTVEFDVAVSAEKNGISAGTMGISVFSLKAGGKIEKETKDSKVSRIIFSVTVDSLSKNKKKQESKRIQKIAKNIKKGTNNEFSSF